MADHLLFLDLCFNFIMKKIVSFISVLFFFALGFSHAWALPPCPSNQNATYDNCFGTYTYANGDEYVGEFKNDQRYGQGTYYSLADNEFKGDKYVGEWKDNKMHGQGTYTYANGDKYVGEYKDNKTNGHGTYYHNNGNKYVGVLSDVKRHGQGTYTFADGSKGEGEWTAGKPNGYFVEYNTDGSLSLIHI